MRLENEKFGDIDSIGVRMPSDLKAKIKSAAKANRHSMNAEIIKRLEKTFAEDDFMAQLDELPIPDDEYLERIESKAEHFKSLEMAIRLLNSSFAELNKK